MEFNQLKITPDFLTYLVIRRRWYILIPLFLALVGGIRFAFVTPRIYEAKTLILVEGQRVPENFVQSIVTEKTSERISNISQQILSRTNLEKVVNEFSLFSEPGYANMYMEDKVSNLRRNISVSVTGRHSQTESFEIRFKGKDPKKVMQVANGLASSYIDENLKMMESQAIGTSVFLESELETIRARLEQLEEKIRNYRKANMGELPEQLETNLRILERLQDNLSDRQQSVREAKIRLAEVKNQVSSRQPSVVVIGGDQTQEGGGETLEELVAELGALQSRYTGKHPDIIRLKKQIAEAETRQDEPAPLGGQNMPARISPELRAQIADLQREIQLSEIDIEGIQSQVAIYQRRIENIPKREQELLSLKRDYQNIQASYDSLLNRKLEADIAVNMERKQKGEQFRIVDPARLPKRPVEPDMRRVFLIVVACGLGIGGGLAFLLEFIDSSFKRPDDLEEAIALPVLATIPKVINTKQLILKRLNLAASITFAALSVMLIGLFGIISLKGVEPFLPILRRVMGS